VIDFDLFMDFWMMLFGCDGLDMRICWIFEGGRGFLGIRTKNNGNIQSLRPFGLHSSLRQSGGRCAAAFYDMAVAMPLSNTDRALRDGPPRF
jgi:hypothetical protein